MQYSRQPQSHESESLAHFFDETSRDHETRVMYPFRIFHDFFLKKFYFEVSVYLHWKHKQFELTIYWEKLILFNLLINPLMVIQLILGPKLLWHYKCIQNIGLVLVSWVSRNIWRDWNQENGPETRPVSWSRISAAATNRPIKDCFF